MSLYVSYILHLSHAGINNFFFIRDNEIRCGYPITKGYQILMVRLKVTAEKVETQIEKLTKQVEELTKMVKEIN
jgi:uncharacterized membrane protein YciS (DUF1049 family)